VTRETLPYRRADQATIPRAVSDELRPRHSNVAHCLAGMSPDAYPTKASVRSGIRLRKAMSLIPQQ
jgi:hypothetical protein